MHIHIRIHQHSYVYICASIYIYVHICMHIGMSCLWTCLDLASQYQDIPRISNGEVHVRREDIASIRALMGSRDYSHGARGHKVTWHRWMIASFDQGLPKQRAYASRSSQGLERCRFLRIWAAARLAARFVGQFSWGGGGGGLNARVMCLRMCKDG